MPRFDLREASRVVVAGVSTVVYHMALGGLWAEALAVTFGATALVLLLELAASL